MYIDQNHISDSFQIFPLKRYRTVEVWKLGGVQTLHTSLYITLYHREVESKFKTSYSIAMLS